MRKMYSSGLSGVAIARKLNLPIRQVYRILEKNNISRRTSAQSNLLRFLKETPSFQIKKKINVDDKLLKISGIMLYWAEGSHYANKQMLDFANSDPDMIRIYLKFLLGICGICKEKIRIYLYCYANQHVEELKMFWSRVTRVPLKQFTQPYVRKDFREDKIGKMPYGLVHVRYADKKLYLQFEVWHREIINKFLGR